MAENRTFAVLLLATTSLLGAGLASGVAVAQEGASGGQTREARSVTRVFTLKHANPERLAQVLEVFGGAFRPDTDLGVLGWTGPAVTAEALEAAVARLDVPPPAGRNLEVTAHLLGVSRGAAGDAPLPDELRAVGDQLRKLLRFESIRLLDTVVMRLRDGSRGKLVHGILTGERGALPYELRIGRIELVDGGDAPQVRLDALRFEMAVRSPAMGDDGKGDGQVGNVRIDTDIDVRVGVKAVVGKASVSGPDDAVVLVIQVTPVD